MVLTLIIATGVFFVLVQIPDSTLAISEALKYSSMIYGTFSIMVTFTELFYNFNKYLRAGVRFCSKLTIRVMDILGFVIGVGVEIGWWFSGYSWIISDIIFTCMMIATIKLFKFWSLRIALFCFVLLTLVLGTFMIISSLIN